MKNYIKSNILPKLPEMLLTAFACFLAGMLIYWFRGVKNAPFISAAIGFVFPILRQKQLEKHNLMKSE
jgi:hypothetical protein